MSILFLFLLCTTFLSIHIPVFLAQSQLPDPTPIHPQTQTFLPTNSSPATIPAFPEQSDLDGCQLDLPDELFSGIKSACGSESHNHDPSFYSGRTHMTRCCPVLAAWLYAAYSRTALERVIKSNKAKETTSQGIEMPLLPDDSETCVDVLDKALVNKGVNLIPPNETCDAVYCYCGIRLHPLSCPEAFYVDSQGKLIGGDKVKKLEINCLNGYAGLSGCSNCLTSLFELNDPKPGNGSKFEERKTRISNKDCELMGLTWLLNKNTTAYIHTVSTVLRALMMSKDGTEPESCTLNSDGMPLAVDSSEIDDQSSAATAVVVAAAYWLQLLFLCMVFVL